MSSLECISPIDGKVVAARPYVWLDDARAAVENARVAQAEWAARPLAERIALVQKGVENIGAMNEDIVPELARQMGRPVRYGGEFGGFKERADYMAGVAEEALALLVGAHLVAGAVVAADEGRRALRVVRERVGRDPARLGSEVWFGHSSTPGSGIGQVSPHRRWPPSTCRVAPVT